jgi:FtsP/CotA-like multicopper oxidase with cupredoxin domain
MIARLNDVKAQRVTWTRRKFFLSAGTMGLLIQSTEMLLAGEKKRFSVTINQGHVAKKFRTLRVTEGDIVEITFTSDKPSELHLHGIDVLANVTARKPATMTFHAKTAGRFPIEAHGAGTHGSLLYVEVHPK